MLVGKIKNLTRYSPPATASPVFPERESLFPEVERGFPEPEVAFYAAEATRINDFT
jgi:hypothetical protein